jgi:hypothetical protein
MFEELITDLMCRYDVILCKRKENSPRFCVCTIDTLGRNVIMAVRVSGPNNRAMSKWLVTALKKQVTRPQFSCMYEMDVQIAKIKPKAAALRHCSPWM